MVLVDGVNESSVLTKKQTYTYHVLLVAWSGEERHVDVKVIGHLNGAHQLGLCKFKIQVSNACFHTQAQDKCMTVIVPAGCGSSHVLLGTS